jgi:hypothetical protein
MMLSGCAAIPTNAPLTSIPELSVQPPAQSATCAIAIRFEPGTDVMFVKRADPLSSQLAGHLNQAADGPIRFSALKTSQNPLKEAQTDYILSLNCKTPNRTTRRNKALFAICWPATVSGLATPLGVAGLSCRGIVEEETAFDWEISLCRRDSYPEPIRSAKVPTLLAVVSATGWGTPEEALEQSYVNAETHLIAACVNFLNEVDWTKTGQGAASSPSPVGKATALAGRTIAVMTFDAKGGLSPDEATLLSDRFAIELDKTKMVTLMSRSKMKEILELQKFSMNCSSTECAVEAGRLLSIEYMVYGSIGQIGSIYTLNTYVASVEKGSTVGATTDFQSKDSLVAGMADAVRNLMNAAAGRAQ